VRRKYIIVRKPSGLARGSLDSAQSTLELGEMTEGEARDYARDPRVAVAPEMPLRLIQPIGEATAPAVPLEPLWGLGELGVQSSPFTGAGIKVAVLDTGIDERHAAFADPALELERVNYTAEEDGDTNGHGTHCAATLFGRNVGGVRIGVAPGVTRAFIGKVLGKGGGDSLTLHKAIHDAVERGCQVISMSLGFDFPGAAARLEREEGLPPEFAAAIALSDYRLNLRLFDLLGESVASASANLRREIILVAAAGNESRRNMQAEFECPAAPPSEATGFTSIGAVDRWGDKLRIASFSNTSCDVCAPGVEILSAQAGTTQGLVAMSGTSMATPHAAGVAALYLERENQRNEGQRDVYSRFRTVFRGREHMLARASDARLTKPFTPAQSGRGVLQAPQE